MRIKEKVGDFRVRELLDDKYLRDRGPFRVYRVTKKKLTTIEAAAVLADRAGVGKAEVGLAGLKDRQGVTTQFMSAPRGRAVRLQTPELKIEAVGFAREPLSPAHSLGNAFDVRLRELSPRSLERIEVELQVVREHGIPNYFGEQRFGNLRHGQGWIARDLVVGEHERALQSLLCAKSESDNDRNRRFKAALSAKWGDWRTCREIAGKFGQHHSVPPTKLAVPALLTLKDPPIPATEIEGNDSGMNCDFKAAGKPSEVTSNPLLNGRRLFSSRVKLNRKLPTIVGLKVRV